MNDCSATGFSSTEDANPCVSKCTDNSSGFHSHPSPATSRTSRIFHMRTLSTLHTFLSNSLRFAVLSPPLPSTSNVDSNLRRSQTHSCKDYLSRWPPSAFLALRRKGSRWGSFAEYLHSYWQCRECFLLNSTFRLRPFHFKWMNCL